MKVKDKIILVTGGANGIGRALCERFHADGAAKIYVADIDYENAGAVAESVNGKAFRLDVADEANCKTVVERILSESGRLDFVVSNAGIGGAEGSLEVGNDIWQKIYEINVLSHVYLARAAFPAMIENGGGAFLITASAAGLLTHPTAVPYAVSKHAARALAENFAIEFGDRGIYVSCLCPQGVKTNMIASAEGEAENYLMAEAITPEACADAVVKGLEAESFLILPHAEVAQYIVNKAENCDRWLHSLRKIRQAVVGEKSATNSGESFFVQLYDSFNRRDIETTLAAMASDVKWANGMEGGFVHGRDAVREYWTRQFGQINSQVKPLKIETDGEKTTVTVHLFIRDLDGNVLSDETVEHIFQLENGLVKSFEIGEK